MDYKKRIIMISVILLILMIFVVIFKFRIKNNNIIENSNVSQSNNIENSVFLDSIADPINHTYTAYDSNNVLQQYTLTEEEIEFYNNHPDYNPEPTY